LNKKFHKKLLNSLRTIYACEEVDIFLTFDEEIYIFLFCCRKQCGTEGIDTNCFDILDESSKILDKTVTSRSSPLVFEDS